jgi:predicted enzyme related to lactoylglutathione lyase
VSVVGFKLSTGISDGTERSVNEVDYFEIGSSDPERSKVFYSGLFGWHIGDPSEARYRMVAGDKGGLWETEGIGGENWAIFYVHVDDVAASLAAATELGATVAIPLVDNGTIEFAHLIDPLGNRFAIWHPKP